MSKKLYTINEIIKNCGGVKIISTNLEIHVTTPDKWREKGIPDKHWWAIMYLSKKKLTPNDIYNANLAARAANENVIKTA